MSVEAATYDDRGAPNSKKVSVSFTLGFTAQGRRLASGSYRPEIEKLLELENAVGDAAVGHFRWYDNPAEGSPNPSDAHEGFGIATVTRQNTGNDQVAGWTVNIAGQGRPTRIENPALDD
nr:hypothetical protein [Litorihabitans aurantiacus]